MKIVDSNRYFLKVGLAPARWLHLATIHYNTREFICFIDIDDTTTYVEEVIGGGLHFIEDEGMAQALHNFLVYSKILDMRKPLLPDDVWYKTPGREI